MSIDSRLTRLRALVDRLERLPASTPRRQWMLLETRARMVDVETGEAPRAMRPLVADVPPRSADENPSVARPAAPGIDEVLWAEDWQADASHAGVGDAKSRPWTRGLRG